MDLRQLRYLVAVADERHFTRAAQREHVAQPALSQQIRRLEERVGLPLVRRTTRRVQLTDAGELLVARARRILAEVAAAEGELADLAGVRSGHVVVGAMQSLGPYDLSIALGEFHRRHPGVDLTVREEVSDDLLAMLRADALDFALLSLAEAPREAGLVSRLLVDEPLVAVLPPTHPLAAREGLRLTDLRGERLISFREGAGLRRILVAAAHEAGFEPQIAFESNNALRGRAMAARGLGVTVLPQSDAMGEGPPVAVVALVDPPLTRDVSLVWRRDRRHAPAARALLDLLRDTPSAGT